MLFISSLGCKHHTALTLLVILLSQHHVQPALFGSYLFKQQETPLQLVQCINERFNAASTTFWDGAMSDIPASFKAAGAWWSSKPVLIPLTIVTQLTANRVTQLWAQCKSWPGPLSAAVHIAIQQMAPDPLSRRNEYLLKKTMKAMAEFHTAAERDPTACRLDIILVYEVYSERRAMLLYPVNQLRNLARLQARTELVGLMDVDMLVSSKLAKSMLIPKVAATMTDTCRKRSVYVIPAFETYGDEAAATADNLVTQSKTSLTRKIAAGIVAPFDARRFAIGHNATNFTRWYAAHEQYEITYSARYEPWTVVNRHAVPWHDVRFRGYGQNKIVHVAHTNASGFKFVVHPSAFIIHRTHEVTAARHQLIVDMRVYNQAAKLQMALPTNTIYGHSRALWDEAKEEMDLGIFSPKMDPASEHCLRQLPWWIIEVAQAEGGRVD